MSLFFFRNSCKWLDVTKMIWLHEFWRLDLLFFFQTHLLKSRQVTYTGLEVPLIDLCCHEESPSTDWWKHTPHTKWLESLKMCLSWKGSTIVNVILDSQPVLPANNTQHYSPLNGYFTVCDIQAAQKDHHLARFRIINKKSASPKHCLIQKHIKFCGLYKLAESCAHEPT